MTITLSKTFFAPTPAAAAAAAAAHSLRSWNVAANKEHTPNTTTRKQQQKQETQMKQARANVHRQWTLKMNYKL